MGLIDIDAKLRKAAELFEPLVIHQSGIIPRIVFGIRTVCTVNCGKQGAGTAEQRFGSCCFFPLLLYDDLLRVGDNDIEVGIINCMQNRT